MSLSTWEKKHCNSKFLIAVIPNYYNLIVVNLNHSKYMASAFTCFIFLKKILSLKKILFRKYSKIIISECTKILCLKFASFHKCMLASCPFRVRSCPSTLKSTCMYFIRTLLASPWAEQKHSPALGTSCFSPSTHSHPTTQQLQQQFLHRLSTQGRGRLGCGKACEVPPPPRTPCSHYKPRTAEKTVGCTLKPIWLGSPWKTEPHCN